MQCHRFEDHRCRHGARRAAAALEFALILPVLMLLAMGVVDFGRIYTTSIVLSSATRVGAEQGATHRLTPLTQASWENRIRSAVIEELQDAPQFDAAKLATSITTTSSNGITRVQVSTQYPFQTIVDWPGLPHTVSLGARVNLELYR